jgi:hypothetical protein
MWFVYVDWTIEAHPRAFYVGKGTASRVKDKRRSANHAEIARAYGLNRQVVLATSVETEALNLERALITSLGTLAGQSSIGCNRTAGGQGTSGHKQSPEARAKIRSARLGKGHPHSEETRQRMSLAKKGKPPNNKGKQLSESTREKMSLARRGKPKPEAWREKMRQIARCRQVEESAT